MPDKRAISFWIAMDVVNEENGCMCFVPKSHQFELYKHKPVKEGFHLLTIDAPKPASFQKCELKPGKWLKIFLLNFHGRFMVLIPYESYRVQCYIDRLAVKRRCNLAHG